MNKKFYNLLEAVRKMSAEGCVMTSDNLPKEILGVRNERNKCYQEWYNSTKHEWEMCSYPPEALTWRWYRVCANELFEFYLQYLQEKSRKKQK